MNYILYYTWLVVVLSALIYYSTTVLLVVERVLVVDRVSFSVSNSCTSAVQLDRVTLFTYECARGRAPAVLGTQGTRNNMYCVATDVWIGQNTKTAYIHISATSTSIGLLFIIVAEESSSVQSTCEPQFLMVRASVYCNTVTGHRDQRSACFFFLFAC